MNLYDATVPVFVHALRNVESWLDKGVAHAELKKFDPEILVHSRLAPDQFPLVRQIQAACDTAKWASSKLAGKQAPSHPDTEQTLAEVRQRIATCIAYLETLSREDFVGCEDRAIKHEWMQGKHMRGGDYLDWYALPNFYFHVSHTYSILRHNGVPLGKLDFLGRIPLRD